MKKYFIFLIFSALLSSAPFTFAENTPDYLQVTPVPIVSQQNATLLNSYIARYQKATEHPWPTLDTHALLKIGMHDHAVLLLKERLAASDDLPGFENQTSDVFDTALKTAVQNYQQRMGLPADGVVGYDTIQALNVPPSVRLNQILVNQKRWADLAPQLGDRFVLVNIPDFKLYAYQNGQSVFNMKIIVGRPTRQTPEIFSKITRIVFNPYWNVPNLIANKDIVPKVLDDPDYLTDMHIHILDRQVDDPVEISQNNIDWVDAEENGFPYHFRQDPGIDNALGLVKFEFNNSNDIYLHDTPAKSLFTANKRVFSSGCVRLENPFTLVAWLMNADPNWDEEQMQEILDANKTAYVKAATPTPIIITYLTAWVDEKGELNFRDDVYHQDQSPQTTEQTQTTSTSDHPESDGLAAFRD